jgi:DNA-binding protein HU-beta
MNKAELVEAIAAELKTSKAEAERSLNAVIDGVKKGVKKDSAVQLIGFGSFKLKERKARKGRNPKTGKTIDIKASKTVIFKPGKALKDSL